ncbi:MAG: ABC transporter permease [Lentisphaerales bacterium]|nr:ABC transporter permease [Lentisphaerales bacterium]
MTNNTKSIWAPIFFLVAVIMGVEAATKVFAINPILLPPPSVVLKSGIDNFSELFSAGLNSFIIAISGFVLSLIFGTIIALIMAQSRVIENSLYPYALFLQCVPIVALAPIFILWFGYGAPAMIIISFVISLFPIITSTVNGLTSVKKEYLEMMKLYGANRQQILFKVRLPSAVPYMVTGARVSAGLSVVGAIIGEYFAGLSGKARGLAYLIRSNEQNADFPYLFATTVAAALLGGIIFLFTGIVCNFIIKKGHFQERNL